MRLYMFPAVAIFLTAGFLWSQNARPGEDPYVPTKLEWAALEMQTVYGVTPSRDNHVGIAFIATADGQTIECLVTYTPGVSAAEVKAERDLAQLKFDSYVKSRRWEWLRINFREIVVPH